MHVLYKAPLLHSAIFHYYFLENILWNSICDKFVSEISQSKQQTWHYLSEPEIH